MVKVDVHEFWQVKPRLDFLTFVKSDRNCDDAGGNPAVGSPSNGKKNLLGFMKVMSRDEVRDAREACSPC